MSRTTSKPQSAKKRLDALAQSFASFEAVPEGLRRHPHDQMVGLAGHDPVDRRRQFAANGLDQLAEIFISAQRIVRDVDPAEMVGDAARAHCIELWLHRGIGAGRDDPELAAPAERVDHRQLRKKG